MMKSDKTEVSKASFSLSRRPKQVQPKKSTRSKRKKRSSSSSSSLPIPSFRTHSNDNELARLEKAFFEEDSTSGPHRKRTKKQQPPCLKQPSPLNFNDDSSDDEDLLLSSAKPIFSKKAAPPKPSTEEKSQEVVAPDSPLHQDTNDSCFFDSPPKEEQDKSSLNVEPKTACQELVDKETDTISRSVPSETVLQEAVDRIVATSDWNTLSIRQIIATLEQDFRLTKETRKIVKRRVKQLLQQLPAPQPIPNKVGTEAAPGVEHSSEKASAHTLAEKAAAAKPAGDENEGRSAAECIKAVDKQLNLKDKPKLPPTESISKAASLSLNDTPELSKPRRRWRGKAPSAKATMPAQQKKVAKEPVKQRGRKRTRGSCQLCMNCPCTMKHESSESPATLEFSQSDAAVEKTLIKRLQKLEKTTERYAVQEDAVRRKLKKHRRDMWKKREASTQANVALAGGSRFLPDVDELEQQLDSHIETTKMSSIAVAKAQSNMFDFAPGFQPTLTQMFGGSKNDEADEAPLDKKQPEPLETIVEEDAIDLTTDAAQLDGVNGHEEAAESEGKQDALSTDDELEVDDSQSNEDMGQVHRLNWSQGVKDGESSTQLDSVTSLWGSLIAGRFDCSWDRLFDDPAETENLGMEELLEMLGPTQATDGNTDEELFSSQPSEVEMSMLSQRGQQLAEDVLRRIESDADKVAALESACPIWRENIIFAMHQREAMDVKEALESVKETKAKLQRAKEVMLKAIRCQEMVLETFEDALDQSLGRLEGSSDDNLNEGFIAPASPGRRGSVECEIKTIVPSSTASLCGHESAPNTPMSHSSLVASQ